MPPASGWPEASGAAAAPLPSRRSPIASRASCSRRLAACCANQEPRLNRFGSLPQSSEVPQGHDTAIGRVLLVVDQLEEVFTQTTQQAARQAFCRRLWQLAKDPGGAHELKVDRGRVSCASLSPDARHILTMGDDSVARIWDAGSGRLLRELKGHLLKRSNLSTIRTSADRCEVSGASCNPGRCSRAPELTPLQTRTSLLPCRAQYPSIAACCAPATAPRPPACRQRPECIRPRAASIRYASNVHAPRFQTPSAPTS